MGSKFFSKINIGNEKYTLRFEHTMFPAQKQYTLVSLNLIISTVVYLAHVGRKKFKSNGEL